MLFASTSKKTSYKVTCIEYANAEFVRIDATSKRWDSHAEAQKYADSVAKSREPLVEVA